MATLLELQERRAAYVAAELKILQSQEYQVGQGGNARRNRRAELADVQAAIKDLDAQIATATATTAGARRNRRAELADVQAAIKDLDAQIGAATAATAGARRMYRMVPGCR